ncbi:hypothetical protein R75461_08002 [Paraburkholderia nemoris]|uniref:phage baseplate plug family protein n=1 Tax=Paraburkholderia nemoris TaxID=2793076 RepID=UPI00190BB606|nr:MULTISPECIES: hypothetical protein [Paraburkholderia]MBK3786768.1 hypothetical protein [Paraburkholderia aspalathi]CAE6861430.1 hypothetical protein R75461_08002 [Paraburkholderia nemoris]
MELIPLAAVPSQQLSVVLAQQNCGINVYQKRTGLFIDLYVAGAPIMTGVLCRDRSYLVRRPYLGFTGELAFVDTQGMLDPRYTGLGNRWQMVYIGEMAS